MVEKRVKKFGQGPPPLCEVFPYQYIFSKTSLFYKMFFFPRDGMGHVVGGIYFGYWRWKTQNLIRSAGFVVCSWSFELVVVKTRPLYKYIVYMGSIHYTVYYRPLYRYTIYRSYTLYRPRLLGRSRLLPLFTAT